MQGEDWSQRWASVLGVQYPEPPCDAAEPPPADWMSENEAAARLRVSRGTAKKRLGGKGVRYGGRWWYAPADVEAARPNKELPPGYVTAPEAIELLGYCSQSWLESLVDRGYIRVWYMGGRKYYRADDALCYIAKRRAIV